MNPSHPIKLPRLLEASDDETVLNVDKVPFKMSEEQMPPARYIPQPMLCARPPTNRSTCTFYTGKCAIVGRY